MLPEIIAEVGRQVDPLPNEWWITAWTYNSVGGAQILLSIAIYIYHNTSLEKLCVFIHANEGEVYSRQIITDRYNQLDISRKRSSKEMYDTFSTGLIQLLQWFISLPPPLGGFNVPIFQLIDIDKSGFYLKKCVSNYRRRHSSCRVRIP